MSHRRPRQALRARALIAAAAAASLTAVSAHALDWANAAGGSYSTPGNWVGGVAPLATDSVRFNLAGTYNVNFDVSPTNTAFLVSAGNVTFRSNGAAGRTFTIAGGGTVSAS